jgi:glucose/arabinose dehydrogenase
MKPLRIVLLIFVMSLLLVAGCRKAQEVIEDAKNTTPVSNTQPRPSAIGERITILPSDLPKPFESGSATNPPKTIPVPPDAKPQAPEGFEVSVFTEGDYTNPRLMIEGPNGDLFLSDTRGNKVYLLRDTNKDGKIDNEKERFVFAENLTRPFGLAINKGYFYIGNTHNVVRAPYQPGQTKLEELTQITDLPGGPDAKGHSTRNLVFNADGTKLYVAAGSESNVSVEEDPRRAAISEYNPDGTGHRIYASGLRNPVGLTINPVTKEIWTCVNERDALGDDLVPDYATSVKDGGFYGWPYYYIGNNVDPRRKDDLAKVKLPEPIVPDVLFESHSAALSIIFYTGTMFPKEYQGNAFVALHGSWNRSLRHGYKVVRIPMKDGKPEGGYINFMNGWVTDSAAKEVWGRPTGLLMLSDGSLLVMDDAAKRVWRVTYKGKQPANV